MNLARHPIRIVAGLVLALVLAIGASETIGDEAGQPREESIAALLQERRSVLSHLVEHQTAAYRQGEADIDAVVQAHQDFLQVGLELANGHEERITLLERSVELAADFEEIAEARHQAGQGTMADVLKSRADCLRVEINLMRERRKKQ